MTFAIMIAALLPSSVSLDHLPVNWFDVTLLIVLGFGIFRGRKNGMTKEVIPTLQWVSAVVAAGLAYAPLALTYNSSNGLGTLWSAVLAYLTIALLVFFIFSGIKRVFVQKLEGSNIFGSGEYYLGMPSGMIRYACILIFCLALLNARVYTAAELAQIQAYNQRWYGGGIYSGDYVPNLHNVQDAVFQKSFVGPYLTNYLATWLIQTEPDSGRNLAQQKKTQPVIHIGK
jgi:uncharacterized membrane protein required for colicin V production